VSPKVVVRADFTMADAEPGEIEKVVAGIVAAAEAEEPGTLVYAWYRHLEDPSRWSVLEVYEDQSALERHLKGPQMRAASKRLGELIDFPNGTTTRMEAIAGKGVR
jgi:quinol monooxygenase YgiN